MGLKCVNSMAGEGIAKSRLNIENLRREMSFVWDSFVPLIQIEKKTEKDIPIPLPPSGESFAHPWAVPSSPASSPPSLPRLAHSWVEHFEVSAWEARPMEPRRLWTFSWAL